MLNAQSPYLFDVSLTRPVERTPSTWLSGKTKPSAPTPGKRAL
jgi:hypothetical protein